MRTGLDVESSFDFSKKKVEAKYITPTVDIWYDLGMVTDVRNPQEFFIEQETLLRLAFRFQNLNIQLTKAL